MGRLAVHHPALHPRPLTPLKVEGMGLITERQFKWPATYCEVPACHTIEEYFYSIIQWAHLTASRVTLHRSDYSRQIHVSRYTHTALWSIAASGEAFNHGDGALDIVFIVQK